jgi:hypothetical protein
MSEDPFIDIACVCRRCESLNTEWFPAFRNGKEVGQVYCYDCGHMGWDE